MDFAGNLSRVYHHVLDIQEFIDTYQLQNMKNNDFADQTELNGTTLNLCTFFASRHEHAFKVTALDSYKFVLFCSLDSQA